jgi:copper(I)-binding protein
MDCLGSRMSNSAAALLTALLLVAFLFVAGGLIGCADSGDPSLRFDSARIRLPVTGTDKSAGYFQVTNNTPDLLTLVAAQADNVRAIEFHTIIRDGDMMRMRRLDSVDVAPGETVEFGPGGKHLMMFGVGELGETVTVVLRSAQGGEYPHDFITFPPG